MKREYWILIIVIVLLILGVLGNIFWRYVNCYNCGVNWNDPYDESNGTINLNKAQKVAERYLELEKEKDYEGLLSMQYMPPDYDQSKLEEENKVLIEVMRIYNEELGDIIKYNYKDHEWQSAKNWTSGEIEPASLTLIYEVEHTKHTVDRTITIVKEDDKLKVDKFGVRGPLSWEIGRKIEELLLKK